MIILSAERFSLEKAQNEFQTRHHQCGAIVNFIGNVNAGTSDNPVKALYLEHHEKLTKASINKIIAAAREKNPIDDVLVIHRIGTVSSGEPIVFVAVAARHRRDAFQAAEMVMDHLKSEALFWKNEIRQNDEEWINPRQQDYDDKQRWKL